MTETDSLKVTEREDGSFDLDWDENDPMWSFLNDKDQEWIENWFNEALKQKLKMYEDQHTIPVEEDPITGEQYITFPKESIQKLGWKEGDTLQWVDNYDGSFTIKKL
jgi:hypothetical protein